MLISYRVKVLKNELDANLSDSDKSLCYEPLLPNCKGDYLMIIISIASDKKSTHDQKNQNIVINYINLKQKLKM